MRIWACTMKMIEPSTKITPATIRMVRTTGFPPSFGGTSDMCVSIFERLKIFEHF
jgi:hypothetical protein